MASASAPRRGREAGRRLFVANTSGGALVDGNEYVFHVGRTHVREGHPLLAAVPMYFDEAEDRVDYEVEAASAAPGEKRGAELI